MTLVFDIEAYKNYTLFALMDINTKEVFTFEIIDGKFKGKNKLEKLLIKNKIITFNGLKFDEPITAFALATEKVTSRQIFLAVQSIIVDKMNTFTFYRQANTRPFIKNHIDIMDVARGMASLKLYGARLGAKKLQDLPYEPETELTKKQMKEVKKYCKNDLLLTELLYNNLHADLTLRENMGEKYNLNLMSLNGAKIAEKVLVKMTGYEGKAPDIPDAIKYVPPKYVNFKTDVMKDVLNYITNHIFLLNANGNIELPAKLKLNKIKLGDIEFQMGIGGIHGSIEQTSVYVDNTKHKILDIDYKSLYPSLLIQNKFYPKHIGRKFLKVYKGIYHDRNNVLKPKLKTLKYASDEYKEIYTQQDGLKLVLNSSFGRLGLRYSKMYDPEALLNITLTGQLTLMMVIEKLYLAGINVFYANTDGITLKTDKVDVAKKITQDFDKITGLEMEYNEFKSCHIRDVNNFVNITIDGKVKSKGAYANPSIEKNSQTPIIYDAVKLFLQNGTPLKKTINSCTDINKFCSSVTVRGGATYGKNIPPIYPPDWQEKLNSKRGLTKKIIKDKEKLEALWVKDNGMYLGKVVRWYYSKKGNSIHYKKNGNKVGKTDGAMPMMKLTKKIPKDLNYEWYYNEANKVLKELGV